MVKRIAIYGLGKEGVSAANYFKNEDITFFDDRDKKEIEGDFFLKIKPKAQFFFKSEYPQNDKFDLVVRSPGVQPSNQRLINLVHSGAKLTSPTQLFFDNCPGKIIGVTGTKGKGTTSTLIYEFLKTKHKDVHLAGNIGNPMLDILPILNKSSFVVLELSSFQLTGLTKSPHVAVVLMITSEHMDWHKDQDEYVTAKQNIVKNQSRADFSVINADYPNSKSFADKTKSQKLFFSRKEETNGSYVKKGTIYSVYPKLETVCKTNEVILPGEHNLENVTAAITVAKIHNVTNSNIKKVLKSFRGLEHRLQLVREFKSTKFYNDSFSTTPETTIAAIKAFKNPKILIVGGSSKKSDFSDLAKEIVNNETLKSVIFIGIEGKTIKDAVQKVGTPKATLLDGGKNMVEIVQNAYKLSEPGDIILLSPACASFDMFKNYQDRGFQFIEAVGKLK